MEKIYELLGRSITALEKHDAIGLRKVSADAINEAAVEQHRELILLSLVDYALSKMLNKPHYEERETTFFKKVLAEMKIAKEGDKKEVLHRLERAEDMVIKIDTKKGHYEETLIDKAKVKRAANLYYQGLSLKRASELTGADSTKVMEYSGSGKIHEFKDEGPLRARLKKAREVLV